MTNIPVSVMNVPLDGTKVPDLEVSSPRNICDVLGNIYNVNRNLCHSQENISSTLEGFLRNGVDRFAQC